MNQQISLCYLTNTSWWDTDVTLLPQLVRAGIRIRVVMVLQASNRKYSAEEIKRACAEMGIDATIVYRRHGILHISNLFVAMRVIKTILADNRQRHSWNCFVYFSDPYLNFLLMFLPRSRLIASYHNYREHSDVKTHNPVSAMKEMMRRFFLRYFKHMHFHSRDQYEYFTRDFPHKSAFYTLMPPKDYGTGPTSAECGAYGETRFLFFGYIRDYKNLSLLIQAFEKAARPGMRLIIAGQCDDFSKYEAQIHRKEFYDLRIRYIGNDEIADIFSTSGFLVLPYSDTTQSGVYHIALRYCLPVIASNIVPFSNCIRDNVDGFLFEPNDAESLSIVLRRCCDMDKAQYKAMCDKNRAYLENYMRKCEGNGRIFHDFIMKNDAYYHDDAATERKA